MKNMMGARILTGFMALACTLMLVTNAFAGAFNEEIVQDMAEFSIVIEPGECTKTRGDTTGLYFDLGNSCSKVIYITDAFTWSAPAGSLLGNTMGGTPQGLADYTVTATIEGIDLVGC